MHSHFHPISHFTFTLALTRHYRTSYYDEEGDELCKGRSSNNSGLVEWIPEVRCWCGEIALGNGNCWYFQWLDSDVSDRVAKVIRGLLKRLDKQDSEMQRLQAVIDEKNVNMKKKHLDSKFNFLYGFGIGIVLGFLCFMHWQRTVKSSANVFQLN
nr:uncharacterized protein LOC109193259 [Ipomoea batatas]